MKFPPLSIGRQRRGPWFAPLFALVLVAGACSSGEPPTTVQVQPSSPGGPASPDTSGLPGPEPMSAPPENDGPGATETNFLTPPCRSDSDCRDGRRCIDGARESVELAGGAATDAGDDAAARDGAAGDGGVVLGRCELPDAG